MKSSKKYFIVGAVLLILVILVLVLIFWGRYKKNQRQLSNSRAGFNLKTGQIIKPEFLTPAEQKSLDLRPGTKAQVLKRNSSGQIMLYKLISATSGPITNLAQIKIPTSSPNSSIHP